LISHLPDVIKTNEQGDVLFTMVNESKLKIILSRMLDESSFYFILFYFILN